MTTPGPRQMRMVGRFIAKADSNNPIAIYAGSCPDYSNDGTRYTFERVGMGVPLLTQIHLKHDTALLEVLHEAGVPFTYTVMIADTEAIDEVFCERFTNGNEQDFLDRCTASAERTQDAIGELPLDAAIVKQMKADSFFGVFGRDKFINFQGLYTRALRHSYDTDQRISHKIDDDVRVRLPLYRNMYGTVLSEMNNIEQIDFLRSRTIRTMAQYLTLGRLIREKSKHPIIINHPTRNLGMYNMRNKFLLEGEVVGQQLPIPVFKLERSIY